MQPDQTDDLVADQFTHPNDPRTMECDEWARWKAAELRAEQPNRIVQLIRIEPLAELRDVGARFIGAIWLPAGRYYSPQPAWAFHYAVLADDISYDELYPKGLPFEAYKRIFECWDDLEFTPDPSENGRVRHNHENVRDKR